MESTYGEFSSDQDALSEGDCAKDDSFDIDMDELVRMTKRGRKRDTAILVHANDSAVPARTRQSHLPITLLSHAF